MFRILCDPSSGSVERVWLKLLVIFCVRSRCLTAWFLDCNMKRNVKFVRYSYKIVNVDNNWWSGSGLTLLCVPVATSWELLSGEVACKSRGRLPSRITGYYLWFVVLRLVNLVCKAYSYIMLPRSSFLCLYCMALRVLVLHLLDQIGSCCVRYAWRKLIWDYCFLRSTSKTK